MTYVLFPSLFSKKRCCGIEVSNKKLHLDLSSLILMNRDVNTLVYQKG